MNRSCRNWRTVSSLFYLLLSTQARLSGGGKSVKRGERQCKLIPILFHANSPVVAALLPWPAWWTLKACARSLLALTVGLHPQRIQRPLGLLMARTTVARRWTRRAVFGNFVATMFTPEGNRAWLSSTHYILSPFSMPDSIPLALAWRCDRVRWLRIGGKGSERTTRREQF